MNPQKQCRSGSQPHKIQLLHSNINRVCHQHQSLLQLLADSDRIHRYRDSVDAINATIDRFQRFRKEADRVLGTWGRYRGNGDGRGDLDVREVHAELVRLRQQFSRVKKQQSNTSKCQQQSLSQKLSQQKHQTQSQLNLLQKNIKKYLSNVKAQILKNQQQHVLTQANHYLQQEAGMYFEDVEADLGILMCQMEYAMGRRDADVGDVGGGGWGKLGEEGQLKMGKLEREVIMKKLRQFIPECNKRLTHRCQLLLKTLQQSLTCLQSTQKSKHRPQNLSQKYQKQQTQFSQSLQKIKNELQGMKMKTNHWLNKIKILDFKIAKLDPRQKENEKVGEGEDMALGGDFGDVQRELGKCEDLFGRFWVLRGEVYGG